MSEATSGEAIAAPVHRPVTRSPSIEDQRVTGYQWRIVPASTGDRRPRRREHACEDAEDADDRDRQARAEALPEEAAGHLEDRVGDQERIHQPADLHLGEAELGHHALGRDADALALEVARTGESEDQDEDEA